MTTASFVEASFEGSWTACGSRSGFVAILVSFLSLSTRPVRYRRDLASIAHPIGVVRQERGPLSGPESGRLRSQSCSLASPPCDNGPGWVSSRAGSAHRRALPDRRDECCRHHRLHPPSLQIRWPLRHPVLRRRDRLIHNASRGHPRAINNLALHAPTAAFLGLRGLQAWPATGNTAKSNTADYQSGSKSAVPQRLSTTDKVVRSDYVGSFGRRPRIAPASEREPVPPLKFAQLVGLVFAVIGVVGFAAAVPLLGVVATAFALFASLLNAAFGICLGCQLYPFVARFRHAPTA
jgi:hypothetical protein